MLKAVQELQLQSVMHSDAMQACMIDNTLYREGQQVGGFTVEKINPNAVIVKNGAYRFELRMQQLAMYRAKHGTVSARRRCHRSDDNAVPARRRTTSQPRDEFEAREELPEDLEPLWSPEASRRTRASVEQLLLEREQITEEQLVQARSVQVQTPGQDAGPDPADDERRQRGADPRGPGRDAGLPLRDARPRRRSTRTRSSCCRRTTSASSWCCRCASRTDAWWWHGRPDQRLPPRRGQAEDPARGAAWSSRTPADINRIVEQITTGASRRAGRGDHQGHGRGRHPGRQGRPRTTWPTWRRWAANRRSSASSTT